LVKRKWLISFTGKLRQAENTKRGTDGRLCSQPGTSYGNLAALNMGSYISLIVIVKSGRLSAENRDLKIAQLEMFTKTGGGVFRDTEKHP
jgi:hypothetical protein